MGELATSYVSEELTIVWLLLITTVIITYLIQRHQLQWIPPSSCAMLLGVLAGGVSRLVGLAQPLRFSPAAFFYALLPPIVFAAGFTLKKRQFFKNFGAILMFAVVGTFISAIVFGVCTYLLVLIGIVRRSHLGDSPFVECLMYGSAISSIDPVATLAVLNEVEVPPLLYNLVFGESVLNDAVAIVLFRSLAQFSGQTFGWGTLPQLVVEFVGLALGSLAVGMGTALACAFTLKRFLREGERGGSANGSRIVGGMGGGVGGAGGDGGGLSSPGGPQHPHAFDATLYEIAIVVMGSYLAYLLAEVVGMSGIVALFFSGICHAHYSYYNVSPEAQVTLRKFFEFASFMCETFVFAYLGIQVATAQHSWDFGLMLSGVPLCVLSRAANIFPCAYLANLGRTYPIPRNLQRMLWAVGLRGAVAYGLVINLPRSDDPTATTGIPAIETATLFIVVVTTLGLGSATGPLLRKFDLEGKDDADLFGLEFGAGGEDGGGLRAGINNPGRLLNRIEFSEQSALHDRFKDFDAAFLKPLFGGRPEGQSESGVAGARSYSQLSEYMGGNLSRGETPTPREDPAGRGHRGAPGDFEVQMRSPPRSMDYQLQQQQTQQHAQQAQQQAEHAQHQQQQLDGSAGAAAGGLDGSAGAAAGGLDGNFEVQLQSRGQGSKV